MLSGFIKQKILRLIARYLEKPVRDYRPISVPEPRALKSVLKPCDIILVEGDLRYSQVIKYVTQSTWSHCGVYIGDAIDSEEKGEDQRNVVEALLSEGVVATPLKEFYGYNTRILRPIALSKEDQKKIIRFCTDKIGKQYDVRNVWDLLCHYAPIFGVFRFKKNKDRPFFGENDPEKVICSSLIAQAFQSVSYPILSDTEKQMRYSAKDVENKIHRKRHFSLYSPRDFDMSPFFSVVKPTIEEGFNYKTLQWEEDEDF